MKGDITRALQFNKTFRYIDGLLCVNNVNFNKHINEIYPSELILKNTTTTPSETSYPDTTLNIGEGNGTVRISVYDKREDFNFKIVNFPYLDSNMATESCVRRLHMSTGEICKNLQQKR